VVFSSPDDIVNLNKRLMDSFVNCQCELSFSTFTFSPFIVIDFAINHFDDQVRVAEIPKKISIAGTKFELAFLVTGEKGHFTCVSFICETKYIFNCLEEQPRVCYDPRRVSPQIGVYVRVS
jgi:hypothetical protein